MAGIDELTKNAFEILKDSKGTEVMLNKKISFFLFRQDAPSKLTATFYEPALCLVLQGRKELIAGQRNFSFGVGELLVVSHEIPVVSKITQACASSPYVALILQLDIHIIRELHEQFGPLGPNPDQAHSLEVNEADGHIIDALYRLMNASRNQTDALVLLPQILREVHYRLLQAPYGGMLRNLFRHNSHAGKISKAIGLIRTHYTAPLAVGEVAKAVGMSASSFFHHFKVITESTPLQYQKNIRLLEARRLLMREGESVTHTALSVGYESASQFSREYARKFGSTPSSDLKTRAVSI